MTFRFWPAKTRERRATVLAGLILLQALCALFFIGDVIEDLREDGQLDGAHMVLESIAAVALVGGVVFLMIELRGLLARMSDMQTGLDVARGQLAQVIDGFFAEWNLTAAERDVAMMILKGFENEAIARIRQTAPGTVRAQATRIYAKSQTDGRAQFISLFVEELLTGPAESDPACDQAPASARRPQDRTDVTPSA
jgi:DNA-binding CsgD family transcriptional regulator